MNKNEILKNLERAKDANGEIPMSLVRQAFKKLPEQNANKWNRLMMYLADLQLTYSPGWGANGCGDQKLYDFITGLIEELEGWTDDTA